MRSNELGQRLYLRPNCLITRRTILFLTGPISLFYYKNPWSEIKNYLYQHGYKVEVIKLPFQNLNNRIEYFKKISDKIENSHVFLDSITYKQLETSLNTFNKITITVLTDQNINLKNDSIYQIETSYKINLNLKSIFQRIGYFLHQKYLSIRNKPTPSATELLIRPNSEVLTKILDHCITLAELDFVELDFNPNS